METFFCIVKLMTSAEDACSVFSYLIRCVCVCQCECHNYTCAGIVVLSLMTMDIQCGAAAFLFAFSIHVICSIPKPSDSKCPYFSNNHHNCTYIETT